MKKIIAFILVIAMCLSLVACSAGNDTDNTTENNDAETVDKSDKFMGEWISGYWGYSGIGVGDEEVHCYIYSYTLTEDGFVLYREGYIEDGERLYTIEESGIWEYNENSDTVTVIKNYPLVFDMSEQDGKTVF